MEKQKELRKNLKEIIKQKEQKEKEIYKNLPFIIKLIRNYLDSFLVYGPVVLFFTFAFYGVFNQIYGTTIFQPFPTGELVMAIKILFNEFITMGVENPQFWFIFYLVIIYAWLINPLMESVGDHLKEIGEWKNNYLDMLNLFGLVPILEKKFKEKYTR